MKKIDFTYLLQPPKKYTFEQPKLKTWVEAQCIGSVLNLFAGKTTLNVNETRVDIDPDCYPDHLIDAYAFCDTWGGDTFDTVILDPPYNVRKAREKYEGRWIGKLTKIKNILPKIIKPAGRVILCGYDSVGMSQSRGFEKIAICLICHGGDHNDTIVIVEKKIEGEKDMFTELKIKEGEEI